jgi:hypothetical protein
MKLTLDQAHVAESGDYFQALFESADENGPYLLVQRQFEDPDGGYCYVETHDMEYSGHARVRTALLGRNSFAIELSRKSLGRIEVTFNITQDAFDELQRVLWIMIPGLKLASEGAG